MSKSHSEESGGATDYLFEDDTEDDEEEQEEPMERHMKRMLRHMLEAKENELKA